MVRVRGDRWDRVRVACTNRAGQFRMYCLYQAIFWIEHRLREPEMGCLLMLD